MDDQGLKAPEGGRELALAIDLAYAGQLSPWAKSWLGPLGRVEGLEQDVLVAGEVLTGRQVVKAMLGDLPLPRTEGQEAVCRRLMELVRSQP